MTRNVVNSHITTCPSMGASESSDFNQIVFNVAYQYKIIFFPLGEHISHHAVIDFYCKYHCRYQMQKSQENCNIKMEKLLSANNISAIIIKSRQHKVVSLYSLYSIKI